MKVRQPACTSLAVAGPNGPQLMMRYRWFVDLHSFSRLAACACPVFPASCLPACLQLPDGTELESVTIEARIQAPAPGKGLWGAFWAFPVNAKHGRWPASGQVRHLTHGMTAVGCSSCCSFSVYFSSQRTSKHSRLCLRPDCRSTSWQHSTR
jgi:hypothetical protein